MFTYLIGYDLNRPKQDYKGLIEKIESLFSTRWHQLDSTWIVKSNLSATEVRDLLCPCIDGNDELFVARLTGEAAWWGLSPQVSEWLKANL